MDLRKINKRCAHCEPLIERHNLLHKFFLCIDYLIGNFDAANRLFSPFLKAASVLAKNFSVHFIKILSLLRIIRIVPIREKEKIQARSLVIINEAKIRGYTVNAVQFLNKNTNVFQLNFRNKSIFFHNIPLADSGGYKEIDPSDKYLFKVLMRRYGIPNPKGEIFRNVNDGIVYGNALGYPLVVKPRRGSLSKHVSAGIKNEHELREAIRISKIIYNEFIVEKHIIGKDYRVTVVNNKAAACALREPPNIIGDGNSTIKRLIIAKNSNPSRGDLHQKNFTLKKITVTPKIIKLLSLKGYTLESVLPAGEKLYLDNKVILSAGADIHDVTDIVSKENTKLLEDISIILKTPLVGFDVIASDISKPYYCTQFAVIEANTSPYIDMHHFPTSGTSHNVAAKIIDCIENQILKQDPS